MYYCILIEIGGMLGVATRPNSPTNINIIMCMSLVTLDMIDLQL